ncbi:unnamed protein product [Moneuplotes crassus]|uniref:Uncharacterized protein n=1 Tax=Euplotes crassus TaxID=5936 RepID=A0AAD1XA89_EUPCR|nr:unnamed protein product [Moneuplotes crassus]
MKKEKVRSLSENRIYKSQCLDGYSQSNSQSSHSDKDQDMNSNTQDSSAVQPPPKTIEEHLNTTILTTFQTTIPHSFSTPCTPSLSLYPPLTPRSHKSFNSTFLYLTHTIPKSLKTLSTKLKTFLSHSPSQYESYFSSAHPSKFSTRDSMNPYESFMVLNLGFYVQSMRRMLEDLREKIEISRLELRCIMKGKKGAERRKKEMKGWSTEEGDGDEQWEEEMDESSGGEEGEEEREIEKMQYRMEGLEEYMQGCVESNYQIPHLSINQNTNHSSLEDFADIFPKDSELDAISDLSNLNQQSYPFRDLSEHKCSPKFCQICALFPQKSPSNLQDHKPTQIPSKIVSHHIPSSSPSPIHFLATSHH